MISHNFDAIKYEFTSKNTQNIFECAKKTPQKTCLWGIVPHAPLHFGYDKTILGLKALQHAGLNISVILADWHALLSYGLSAEQAHLRANTYKHYLSDVCGLKARYILGSNFQLTENYSQLLMHASRVVTNAQIKKSLPVHVLKKLDKEGHYVSVSLFHMMQTVDPIHLSADYVYGDDGQQKVYKLGETMWKKLSEIKGLTISYEPFSSLSKSYPETIYISHGCDINGMSLKNSTSKTRISIHEKDEGLEEKVKKMFAPPASLGTKKQKNALLEYFKFSVFPWNDKPVIITDGKTQKSKTFQTYAAFEKAYLSGEIHPSDCKIALFAALKIRIQKTQDIMAGSILSWVDLDRV